MTTTGWSSPRGGVVLRPSLEVGSDYMSLSPKTPLAAGAAVLATVAASSMSIASPALARTSAGPVVAVGAENEYADVISQIGGPYVRVSAIMSNPNTDPHEFEASAKRG